MELHLWETDRDIHTPTDLNTAAYNTAGAPRNEDKGVYCTQTSFAQHTD